MMNSSMATEPKYRIEKENSQSTVISTTEETSGQYSSSSDSKSESESKKKGWPNACVKQSIHSKISPRSDNNYRKPAHSYSSLITEAIQMSAKGQMTLSEIYFWLIDKFPYFKAAGTGWKNSIRHTLSTNQKFIRVPRPAKEPGKGAYWTIRESEKGRPNLSILPTKSESSIFVTKMEPKESMYSNNDFLGSEYMDMTQNDANEAAYIRALDTVHLNRDALVLEHYSPIYLPAFPSDGNSPRLTHDTAMNSTEFYFGYDPLLSYAPAEHTIGTYSTTMGPPRIVLSRDSSFFDDWTANNSVGSSSNKLGPFGLILPGEIDFDKNDKSDATSPSNEVSANSSN